MAAGRREVAVLMSDIRGFATLSEKMDPEELVSLLNRYFKVMIDIVFRHDGMLDKFVGDEIIAVFGAPLDQPDSEASAIRCAAEMRKPMADFNAAQRASGGPRSPPSFFICRRQNLCQSICVVTSWWKSTSEVLTMLPSSLGLRSAAACLWAAYFSCGASPSAPLRNSLPR